MSARQVAPSVSVVVLTHASARTLPTCLTSLRPQVEALHGELLVVDNASPDDTVAVARGLGFEPVATGGNLGFARGCNVGARLATGDVLVFMNPDAVLDEGALASLVDVASSAPRVGPVGGRAHTGDGAYDPRCVLGRPSLWGALSFAAGVGTVFRNHPVLDPEHGPRVVPDTGEPQAVAAVSGALMAVPRSLWEALDGFDERFFLYGEDVDLCVRAAALGWQPVVAGTVGYTHVGGASSSVSETRDVLLHRGKAELYHKHLRPGAARAAVTALQTGAMLRGAPARLPQHRFSDRAHRWRSVFLARDRWRDGYAGHGGEVAA
jgi:N-acetylglucosaminyl-diphospho-decaprenol L-rhamnosyltransferase